MEEQLARPDLYDNPARAQELTREHARLKQALADGRHWLKLKRDLAEAEAMVEYKVASPRIVEGLKKIHAAKTKKASKKGA